MLSEKEKTIPVVTWWKGDIFWDLSEKDLRKKKYWSWNWDFLGFIQLEIRVEAIQGRVNLMIKGHLFLY